MLNTSLSEPVDLSSDINFVIAGWIPKLVNANINTKISYPTLYIATPSSVKIWDRIGIYKADNSFNIILDIARIITPCPTEFSFITSSLLNIIILFFLYIKDIYIWIS